MKFCPNCLYVLDISKANIATDNETIEYINTVSDIFKVLPKVGTNDIIYKATCSNNDVITSKKYSKLKQEDKDKIDKMFTSNIITNANFKCNNCDYTKNITETTLLYSYNKDDVNDHIVTTEECKLLFLDPILPHTKDYICKNDKCKTFKNPELKDAIFYKHKNSYKVIYICGVCYHKW